MQGNLAIVVFCIDFDPRFEQDFDYFDTCEAYRTEMGLRPNLSCTDGSAACRSNDSVMTV